MNGFIRDTVIYGRSFLLFSLVMLCLIAKPVLAATVYVPDELKPWQDWVLQDHPELACPVAYGNETAGRECAWSNKLNIEVRRNAIAFQQHWHLYKDGWVILPGNDKLWPSGLSVNGKAATLTRRAGLPAVFLTRGEQEVTGLIPFKARPSSIPLPVQTGIVSVTIDGKPVARPNLQRNSILLRDSGPGVSQEKLNDSLSVQVYRNILDGAPVQIKTRIQLSVSGRDREVRLGRFKPGNGEPVDFRSELPARIEQDGSLRIQVSAGEWDLELTTRHNERAPEFQIQRRDDTWPAQEIWSFTPDRNFRSTKITGALSIDPSQAGVPFDWGKLATYLLDESSRLKIEELPNNSEVEAIANLRLQKAIWLDFDGSGLTVQDRFSGLVNRATRLTVSDDYELGKMTLADEPQLITRMDGSNSGVELRRGQLQLETVSRVDLQSGVNPVAVGWQTQVQQLSASLHTPPGWLLLHVGGPDQVNQTWLTKWNLWAIFLVLLISGALLRTTGVAGGLLALATLFLTYHDDYSPGLILLIFAIFLAITQLQLGGMVHRYIVMARNITMLGIMLATVAYIVDEVRMGMYPQLARQGDIYNPGARFSAYGSNAAFSTPETLMEAEMDSIRAEQAMKKRSAEKSVRLEEIVVTGSKVANRYDTNENIQTGPGIPGWYWDRTQLVWSGPVLAEQALQLYILSPGEHRLLRLVKICLMLLLVLTLASHCYHFGKFKLPRFLAGGGPGSAAIVGLSIFIAAVSILPGESTAAIPGPEILKDLESRLTVEPECAPACASIRSVSVQVKESQLEVNLIVDAETLTSFPLPVATLGWIPQQIELVGGKAISRNAGDSFHIALPQGQSIVRIRGPVFGDDLQLRFPVQAHNMEVFASGWKASGLDGTGLRGDLLQLTRVVVDDQKADENNLLPDPIRPYFRVERTLTIGNDWEVNTVVQRVAPAAGSVNFRLPLLEGESVISPGVRIADSHVEGTIRAGQPRYRWQSTLEKVPELKLVAGDIAQWVETWRVSTSPRWHIETAGLKPVLDGSNLPTWKPWAGESLSLMFTKPEAARGNVQTIQELRLSHLPGQRISSNTMDIKVTASQAVDFPVGLPGGAVVKEFLIDNATQQLPGGETVKVPLHPGEQNIRLRWELPRGISMLERTPVPTFSGDISNIIINFTLPADRWPLLVGGPSIGPALLFWGVVVAIILVASLLGRISAIPVKTWEWILLGVGMSTISFPGSLVVVCWFIAMAARNEVGVGSSRLRHNFMQLALVMLTVIALYNLLSIIPESLLSSPDMQIVGNGSHSGGLIWYQDRAHAEIPSAWLFSLPMWSYRLAMLCWSIWIVFAMLRWARWGWRSFSAGTVWLGSTESDQTEEKE